MRLRQAASLLFAISVLIVPAPFFAACKAKAPARSAQIAQPEVRSDEESLPLPERPQVPHRGTAFFPVRPPVISETMLELMATRLGPRDKVIELAQAIVIAKGVPEGRPTTESLLGYAITQPQFGGLIREEGIFCVFKDDVPVAAITTKVLDYRTAQRAVVRRYTPQELRAVTRELTVFARRHKRDTGKTLTDIVIFSESYRDAAVEVILNREAGLETPYSLRNWGPAVVILQRLADRDLAVAGEIFPVRLEEGIDLDDLLKHSGPLS